MVAIPPDRFESNNTIATATPLGNVSRTTIGNLTLDTASDVDVFSFRGNRASVYAITAFGTTIQVVDSTGRILASGNGQLNFRVSKARSTLYVEISATNHTAVSDYTLSISQIRSGSRSPRASRAFLSSQLAASSALVVAGAVTSNTAAFPAWFAAHRRRP